MNRYSYCYNRPLVYIDSSGHFPILIIAAVIVIAKAIDYGWTAWDAAQSARTVADPYASDEDKFMASLNIGMAVGFEALEPDDLLPVSLPIDDIARKAAMKGAKEALEEGGMDGLQIFVRKNMGEHSGAVLNHLGIVDSFDPSKLGFSEKIMKQMGGRGWTRQSIEELVANPALTRKSPSIINRLTGNSVTYFYRADGYYVVSSLWNSWHICCRD